MATIMEQYQAAKTAAAELYDKAKSEGRDLTDDERAKFDGLIEQARGLAATRDRLAADSEALEALTGDFTVETQTLTGQVGSLGQQFIEAPEYKALMAQYKGRIPSGQRIQMDTATLDLRNALVTDPGASQGVVRFAGTELAQIDLFDAITVIDDAPAAVKTFTAAWTDAADVVAEGAVKPEASLVWASKDVTLGTVAQHVPVTVQALAHNPTLKTRIDGYLVNGVRAKLAALVAADVAVAAGVQVQAYDTDLRTTLRKALTKAQQAQATIGAGPASILVSAVDAESLDLEAVASAFHAAGEGPKQLQTAWRTPLVVSAAIPAGYAYVGDLKQLELYTSGGINVTTGWVNDQFIRNQLTLLGETEAAANTFMAAALVKADLTAA